MRAEGDKSLDFLALASGFPRLLNDEFDGRSQVIITDPMRDASKVLKGAHMPPEEAFLPLRRKDHRKRAARVAQAHHKQLDLLTLTSKIGVRLAPVHLGIFPWLKFEGKKHLWSRSSLFVPSDSVANGRFTALVSLFSDQFKDAMGRVALFAWEVFILG
jgi:hypothetical protein